MKRFFLTFLTLCLMSTASWSSLEESEPLEKVYKEATVTLSDDSFIDRFHYGEVESTQKTAKDHLNSKQWSVVTADSQSKGYGLWGRSWESPVGNCFSTFCIPLGIEHAEHISWIPPLAGLAIADTLLDLGVSDDEIGLRWINNVLVSGKKVAGIIVEMDLEESMMMLRVGIGLNIDMTHDVLSTIDQPATSLRQLLDTPLTVEDVLSVLASKLKNRFSALEKSISPINEYDSKLLYKGETIVVREG